MRWPQAFPTPRALCVARRMDLGYASGRVYVSRRPCARAAAAAKRTICALSFSACARHPTRRPSASRPRRASCYSCGVRFQAFGGNPTCEVTANVTESCPVLAYKSVFAYCECAPALRQQAVGPQMCSGREQRCISPTASQTVPRSLFWPLMPASLTLPALISHHYACPASLSNRR